MAPRKFLLTPTNVPFQFGKFILKGPFKNDVTDLRGEGYPKIVTKSNIGERGST